MTELDPTLLQRLSQVSPTSEDPDLWPRDQFNWLARAGVLGWVIPREYGGSGISSTGLIAGYEQLATACMVTTFVLTQRNGACQRIAGAEHGQSLRDELLPPLARGEQFATVGISHLTT